jgi:hypothetical protein
MGEYTSSELGPLHPTVLSHYGTKFSDLSTVDSDRDDLTRIDAIEKCASVVSEFARGDSGHAAAV